MAVSSEGDARSALDDLRLGESDLVSRAARALGAPAGRRGFVRTGIAIALVTWTPLVLLTAVEHTILTGPTIPGRYSFGTHARLLLAIPLFFYAEFLFSGRVAQVLRSLLQADIIRAPDIPKFLRECRRTDRLWDSWAVELALIAIVAVGVYSGLRTDAPAGVSTWRTRADGSLSLAGWWYFVVSLPTFQFLLGRWAWRLVLWGRLLWRLSRMDLRLIPTHPDLAGGLGPLAVAVVDLSPLTFACSALAASTFAERIIFAGAKVPDLAVPATAIVVGVTAFLIAPLFFFVGRLLEVKQQGLLVYGEFATTYIRSFERKWLRGERAPEEPLLGTPDVQSLADLGNSFAVISDMRVVPITLRQVGLLAVSSAVPMLPLVLFKYPLDELILGGIKALIGV